MSNEDYHDPNRSEMAPMNAESFYTHLYQGQDDDYEDEGTSIFEKDPQYLNEEGGGHLDPNDLFGEEETSPREHDQDDHEDPDDQNDHEDQDSQGDPEDRNDQIGQGDIASEESNNSDS
jgi:hypothetical protein